MDRTFKVEDIRPIRDQMTISRDSKLGQKTRVTFFSLGKGTSITQESYDHKTMYIGAYKDVDFIIGCDKKELSLKADELLIVDDKTLAGMKTDAGCVYTEIILNEGKEEIIMNEKIKTNEVFALKSLIDYEEGSIANLDIVKAPNMKYVLMAFDEGTGLTPHRAPGNAIVFALEGKAVIGYEGTNHEISEGECFRFEKNGLHSVTAKGKFKMALLLVIE